MYSKLAHRALGLSFGLALSCAGALGQSDDKPQAPDKQPPQRLMDHQPQSMLSPETPPAARAGNFPLPGASFSVPLPDGFCLPTQSYEAIFKILGAADTSNLTDISLGQCAEETAGTPMTAWVLIKTPLESLRANVGSRHDLVEQLKNAAHSDEMQKMLTITSDDLKDKSNLTAVFGPDAKGSAKFDELAYDDNGVYFGGVVNYTDGHGNTITTSGAYSVTIVNGRAFYIYFFKKYEAVSDIPALVDKTRAETAAFVAANGG